MDENNDAQATARATPIPSQLAEISGNAQRESRHIKLTKLLEREQISDNGNKSSVDAKGPQLRRNHEDSPSISINPTSTATSTVSKRKAFDSSAEREILTGRNAKVGLIVQWENITLCLDRDLQDEAWRLFNNAFHDPATNYDRDELQWFMKDNELIINTLGKKWLISKKRFWVIDSAFGSSVLVRPMYTSHGRGHWFKPEVEEYVSVRHPFPQNDFVKQSKTRPLTVEWWHWKEPLKGMSAVKLSECETLKFTEVDLEVIGELTERSAKELLRLITTVQARPLPSYTNAPSQNSSTSTPLGSNRVINNDSVRTPGMRSAESDRKQAAITVRAESAMPQSSTSHYTRVQIIDTDQDTANGPNGSAITTSSPPAPSSSLLANPASSSPSPLPQDEERPSKRQKIAQTTSHDTSRRAPTQPTSTERHDNGVTSTMKPPTPPKGRGNKNTSTTQCLPKSRTKQACIKPQQP